MEEVWHFEDSTQYDPETKKGGLFASYINTFLKVKQESSGWPDGVETEEEKEKYIKEYFEVEGILLDREKIKYNPGLRAVSKAMLNTLWGKFGQSDDMAQTTFTDSPAKVLEHLGSAKIEVTNLNFHTDYLCEMSYKVKECFRTQNKNTNVVIAAFTTSYARLKLYSVISKLNSRCLYFDTDSAVYIEREGEYSPPLGNNLGELTSEVNPKDGKFIQTFISGGPKNYAYKLDSGKTVCKVRGITLNYNAVKLVNFDTLNEMVQPHPSVQTVRVPLPGKITRDTVNKKIVNRDTHKDYRVVYTKRVRQPNGFDTLPYGYRK